MHHFLIVIMLATAPTLSANTIDSIRIPTQNDKSFDVVFEKIIKESNSYKDFKLITNPDLSIISTAHKAEVAALNNSIVDLEEKLNAVQTQLDQEIEKVKDLKKPSPITSDMVLMYGGVLGLLLLFLIVYVLKNKKLKDVAVNQKSSLDAIEVEFDEFKRSAMERELKIKRELMDEKNKNKQH